MRRRWNEPRPGQRVERETIRNHRLDMTVKSNFFEEGSPFLKHPLLTDERTAAEVDALISILGAPAGSRLLDVGCGFGRHSVEFARRGYSVVAIDPSSAMIAAARRRAEAASVEVEFHVQAAQSFVTEAKFDAAICLFTTLGQISEEGDNVALIGSVFEALKPGTYFIVEVPRRETTVARLKAEERLGSGERYALVQRRFDGATNTLTEDFEVVTPQERRDYHLCYRLFNQPELTALLTQAGFRVLRVAADPLGANPVDDSPMMWFFARK